MTYIHHVDSPLGGITMASDGDALTGLWFDGQRHFPKALAGRAELTYLPVFEQAEAWLRIYFSGRDPGFTPPLSLSGTPFRTSVWDMLLSIPFGQTATYGQLAERLGSAARAVGGAVGRNPVSLIVPCHRVVGADGRLTGYAGGLERKTYLLRLEGAL
ncbi:MAG: methylated-DNA--[protein]-cysteine S-methyltransferase [Clostridiales bacterium]|nr:methylated-DNA--[protein]-cysteine S-methyltransferase [Clostridiales bacterium]